MAIDSLRENEYKTFITSRRDDIFTNGEIDSITLNCCPLVEAKRKDCFKKDFHFNSDVRVQDCETMVKMALEKSPMSADESAPPLPAFTDLMNRDDDVFQDSSREHCSLGHTHRQPVHRKHVEMKGDNKIARTFVLAQRNVPEPFSQTSLGSIPRMYQPRYSNFRVNVTDIAPVQTAADSPSSSFRSESGDRDAACSSASRDSNGSSQDASSVSTDLAFDRSLEGSDHCSSSATTPTLASNPTRMVMPHPTNRDRRSVVAVSDEHYYTAPPRDSWLRSPLKWRGIFGSKTSPKLPSRFAARTENDHQATTRANSKLAEISVAKPRAGTRLFTPPNSNDKNLAPASKSKSFLAISNQQQAPPRSKTSLGSLNLKVPFSYDSFDVRSVVSTDKERDQTMISKIRDRWSKYIRMLKPPYGKKADTFVVRGGSLPSQRSAPHEFVRTRARSMPAIVRTPPQRPRSNPANSNVFKHKIPTSGPSSGRKNSAFPSQTGSLVASSPGFLKSSSPRLMSFSPKAKRSPRVAANIISPRMSSSSISSISDLHSAVQGAIAHCKQSHTGELPPASSTHHL